jgi:hypothetical protein
MGRFEGELKGLYGEYWKIKAEEEIAKIKKDYEDGEIKIENGIAYNRIGRVVMNDIAKKIKLAGLPIDIDATIEAREKEVDEYLSEYRRNYKGVSEEEKNEMRSAFGEGAKVRDIISGEIINL